MGPNKYVHLMFAIGTLVLAFLLAKTGEWVWSYFAKPNDLIINGGAVLVAVVAGYMAYRNERVFAAAYDVTARAGEGDLAHPQGDLCSDGGGHRDGGHLLAHPVGLRHCLGLPRKPGDALTGEAVQLDGDEMVRGPHLFRAREQGASVADGSRAPGRA